MASLFNDITQALVDKAGKLQPTLKVSKFLLEGVLTPEEFVQAGDLLVFKCPTWAWGTYSDKSRAVDYLPAAKQFLITRNVPCYSRVRSLEETAKTSKNVLVDIEGEGEWVSTHSGQVAEEEEIPEIASASSAASASASASATNDDDNDDDDDGDIPDMLEYENEDNVSDPAALADTSDSGPADNILKTRTYDLSITYDNHYRTPKLWLFGYDENGKPLTPKEVFADISQDHANKTVTIKEHPLLGIPHAFIHPCRHAAVMKKIITRLQENGKEPRVDNYLFLFLKFISAVIPTMEYDYTMEMEG